MFRRFVVGNRAYSEVARELDRDMTDVQRMGKMMGLNNAIHFLRFLTIARNQTSKSGACFVCGQQWNPPTDWLETAVTMMESFSLLE